MDQQLGTRDHIHRLLLLGGLFIFGLFCCRVFSFTVPILNYLFVLLVLALPFYAIRYLSRLSRWSKRIGISLLTPLLFLEVAYVGVFAACRSPELHHYRVDSCIQEEKSIQHGAYSVHLLVDCGGGATVASTEWIEQRMRVVPGLDVVRVVASFYYPATYSDLSLSEPNTLHLTRHKGLTPEGRWFYSYRLKPHVYF